MYIKLYDSGDLGITVSETIRRGDNLVHTVNFLLPRYLGGIDIHSSSIYLCYIRPDGKSDIVLLQNTGEMYRDRYVKYSFQINNRMTYCAGEVCIWLHIFGDVNDVSVKSGECMIEIFDSMDEEEFSGSDPLENSNLSAIAQVREELLMEIAKKADGLRYEPDTHKLKLLSGDKTIGNSVKIPTEKYKEDILGEAELAWDEMGANSDAEVSGEPNVLWNEM